MAPEIAPKSFRTFEKQPPDPLLGPGASILLHFVNSYVKLDSVGSFLSLQRRTKLSSWCIPTKVSL